MSERASISNTSDDVLSEGESSNEQKIYDFVHLRMHSEFSMVDGICRLNPTIEKVAELGMPAIALTDNVNFCGLIKYYRKAISSGVKPIVGVDLWINDGGDENDIYRITLLCQNDAGYLNAKELISKAYQTNQKLGKPLVEKDWLIEHNQGLIILSGGREGDVGRSSKPSSLN